MRCRAFCAVHIERQANDEADRLSLLGDLFELLRIYGEFCSADRGYRRRYRPLWIADSNADGLGARIKAQQRALVAKTRRLFLKFLHHASMIARPVKAPTLQGVKEGVRFGVASLGFGMRWFILLTGLLIAVAVIAGAAKKREVLPADIRVTVKQRDGAELLVTYELKHRRRALIFGELSGGYRERRWSVLTPGFELLRLDTEDQIVRTDGRKFERVTLAAKPDLIRLPKEYQPIARYGVDGAMIYTGHFWPMTGRGGRTNTVFNFTPQKGASVVAFGEAAPRLENWRSPMAHPAFVYVGPLEPVETPDVMTLVDPAAPDWIKQEFETLTPAAFAHLADVFGFSPETKPNLFLAAPLGSDEGRLSYAGDALPAQFQITLEGAAWRNDTDQSRDIFRKSTIHEAVHLWQSAARPSADKVAAWIHEGAADAIAAEAMVALGLWGEAHFVSDFDRARAECALNLEYGSLAGAEKRKSFRALYGCGHVIAVAVSRAERATVGDFWRNFVQIAAEQDEGYGEDLFYETIKDRTQDEGFVEAVRYFVRTPHADPGRAIDRLLASAAPPLASPAGR